MSHTHEKTDVILIGAGIMSATLGSLLKEVAPEWEIKVFEKLTSAGEESSNEWNNAGTGHAALCELNYTSEKPDGTVNISKAVKVNEQFQLSRQYWSYLVERGLIQNPAEFIRPIPHVSMVQGEENIAFLKRRMEALSKNPLFHGMEFTDDHATLTEWLPLMMEGRDEDEQIAATKVDSGTDVNFGALTRMLFTYLKEKNVEVNYEHEVKDITRTKDGFWELTIWNQEKRRTEHHQAKFLFIGAGGGSLSLLQKTGIPEAKKIGGFPVSGLFLVCNDPDIAEQHHAKVYGKAKVGAPPMSVPHLDTRYIDGKKSLLFGPFAGFSPKFLKSGSNLDLIKSVNVDNVITMLAAGAKEMELTKYLIQQLMLSHEARMEELREFIPYAQSDQWEVVVAGQRVQVIKDTEEGGRGTLQFGTEVVSASDGSVAALLGASPGASTAVHVMLEVLEKCFPERMKEWAPKIKEMIPSYGIELSKKPELFRKLFAENEEALGLSSPVEDRESLPASS
ncbi:malate dehydrogenase (quinone) [Mangrovibacillus cuniculi]|uniref:Probable malate:quinone oxidoreductase n=1 Tax=Mangrovibacillus cuniculi TaxID=2593652 RepID=A0A7S8HGR4_9BACI|nr:malate dehydrogenase (quinone) [Mangrovibacillus cuniculi]QPC47856.1 malate dehydrogenase (quinone) [Mangrovibacillus cuniculi]